MGNNPSKERHASSHSLHPGASSSPSNSNSQSNNLAPTERRSSRHDISFLGLNSRSEIDPSSPDARKETRPEKEARKLEKERIQRAKERERSMREESVDGGYLVTVGVYTGTEDFSKPIVRRLQLERRLAPFWKGLNDHDETWADNQFVAASKGLPIPDPEPNVTPQTIAVPTSISNDTPSLSPAHPAFSSSISSNHQPSPPAVGDSPHSLPSHLPFFRSKTKPLYSAGVLSRSDSQPDIESTPQEIHLPADPFVNGQRVETYLYRNASECPICFLYYPPFLNKTRCCDQPICSECFVQIKRAEPHPPEHHDDDPPAEPSPEKATEEYQLVSEPATCPYCKMPEFGITYEPPPFRRGLAHANPHHLRSAMSSSSSINSTAIPGHSRRRNQSLSVDSPNVITTDYVRPDWSKKLADARAHAFRRAAAATALHNAAYILNSSENSSSSRFAIGRRRRNFFGGDGELPPALANVGVLLAAADRQQQVAESESRINEQSPSIDLFPGRSSSRRNRIDTLEDMMLMEAIRQSIALEEERKRKEEKEAAKQAKKEEKEAKKNLNGPSKLSKLIARSSSSSNIKDSSSSSQVESASPPHGKGKAIESSLPLPTFAGPSTQSLTPLNVSIHSSLNDANSTHRASPTESNHEAHVSKFGTETPNGESSLNFPSLEEVMSETVTPSDNDETQVNQMEFPTSLSNKSEMNNIEKHVKQDHAT